MAVGFQKPFIVVNSGAIEILDNDEQRVILGHELGHIMSGHPTYTTLALIILNIGFSNIPVLGLITLPIQLALLEWYRKAELSADRAGLLATQDPRSSMQLFMRFAGGPPLDDETSLDEFLRQAEEYESAGNALDGIFKILNVAFRTHPFNTVRAGELQRWIRNGAYDRILAGDYPHRGDDDRPLSEDYDAAASYYGDQARDAVTQVRDALRDARDAFTEAFRNTTRK
jgi:Zn-dependent protease with chaperone function